MDADAEAGRAWRKREDWMWGERIVECHSLQTCCTELRRFDGRRKEKIKDRSSGEERTAMRGLTAVACCSSSERLLSIWDNSGMS